MKINPRVAWPAILVATATAATAAAGAWQNLVGHGPSDSSDSTRNPTQTSAPRIDIGGNTAVNDPGSTSVGDPELHTQKKPVVYSNNLGADTDPDLDKVREVVQQIKDLQGRGASNIEINYAVLAGDDVLDAPDLGLGAPNDDIKLPQVREMKSKYITAVSAVAKQMGVSLKDVNMRAQLTEERISNVGEVQAINNYAITGGYASTKDALTAYEAGTMADGETLDTFKSILKNGVITTVTFTPPSLTTERSTQSAAPTVDKFDGSLR